MKFISTIFIFLSLLTSGQTDKNLVDSLKFVLDVPYICRATDLNQIKQNPLLTTGCGDIIFWRTILQKEKIIPQLIQKLSDTTQTAVTVPNFGGQFTVADIAYTVLREIIKDIPTFDLLGTKFDKQGCGYCSYWTHVRKSIKNRQRFQTSVSNWYKQNQNNLIWVTRDIVLTCDCAFKHPNGGHFELKK